MNRSSFKINYFRMTLVIYILLFSALPAFCGTLTLDTNAAVAQYFERAKQNEAALIAFLHKMPKGADLHNHPSGTVYTESLLDNAIRNNLVFDRVEQTFVRATSNPSYTATELKYEFWKTAEVLDALSMRNNDKDSESGHTRFFRSFERFDSVMPDNEGMLSEIIARAAAQNISYLELMTPSAAYDLGKMEEKIKSLEHAKQKILAEYAKKGTPVDVEVAYVVALNRGFVPQEMQEPFDERTYADYFRRLTSNAMQLVASMQDSQVRGITILSPEDAWFSRNYFELQMKIIDEEWRKLSPAQRKVVRLNLHAGELTLEYSPYEIMRNRISETIRLGHATRIGHGVSVMWEDNVYELLKKMRDEKIAVEICLTSHEGILKVAGADTHPFRLYWDAGVPVTLCTDDEGISRSNLTAEFAKAAQWFDLSYGELKWIAFNNLEYSFIPGESMFKEGDYNRPKRGGEFPAHSQKAVMQQKLWKAFFDFERQMEQNIKIFE